VEYAIPDVFDERFVLVLRHVKNQQFDRQEIIWLRIHLVKLRDGDETNELLNGDLEHILL